MVSVHSQANKNQQLSSYIFNIGFFNSKSLQLPTKSLQLPTKSLQLPTKSLQLTFKSVLGTFQREAQIASKKFFFRFFYVNLKNLF